jgi:putative Mg2+ transporter-C (MgtC) family protein
MTASLVGLQVLSATLADELIYLGAAFLLCGVIGVERQLSQKSAGVRTHMLVGMGSAGFTLVSAYGFAGIDTASTVIDPSRIAAQVVSGIGFLGAGVIFMRHDVVKGLTTAATIWLTAAVGMACAAGLVVLAAALTAMHLVAVTLISRLVRRLPVGTSRNTLVICYLDGHGALRGILEVASAMGYQTVIRSTTQTRVDGAAAIVATMQFDGRPPLQSLVAELMELVGVHGVSTESEPDGGE